MTPSPSSEWDQGQTPEMGLVDPSMIWAIGENIPAVRLLFSPWEKTNLRVFFNILVPEII